MIGNISMGSMPPMMPPSRHNGAQAAADMMSKADADSNGVLSKDELGSFLQSISAADGSSSASQEMTDKMFADFDADGDGSITQDEAQTAMDNILGAMRGEVNGMNPPPPPPQGQGPMDPESFLSSADTDGNGSVNQAEFTAMLESGPLGKAQNSSDIINAMFGETDSDGDSEVSLEELQAAMENHRPRHEATAENDKTAANQQADNSERLEMLVSQLLKYYQSNDSTNASRLSETA